MPPGIYQFSVPESMRAGTPVGRIRATDKDIGSNAEMDYTVVSGDGIDMFDISTDKDTQEGVITVVKVNTNRCQSASGLHGHVSRHNASAPASFGLANSARFCSL